MPDDLTLPADLPTRRYFESDSPLSGPPLDAVRALMIQRDSVVAQLTCLSEALQCPRYAQLRHDLRLKARQLQRTEQGPLTDFLQAFMGEG